MLLFGKYILIVIVAVLMLCVLSYISVPVYDFQSGRSFAGIPFTIRMQGPIRPVGGKPISMPIKKRNPSAIIRSNRCSKPIAATGTIS